jgi:hypothetical protein
VALNREELLEAEMQDAPQVGWDIDVQLPWPHRLFVLYVFVVVAISAVKSASVLRQLLPFTGSSLRTQKSDNDFLRAWEKCSNRIQSMKRIVVITLLLSLLTPAYLLRNDLAIFAKEKVFGPGAFLSTMSEVLTVFALGILACTVIYAACAFLEGALVRRVESWRYSRGANEVGHQAVPDLGCCCNIPISNNVGGVKHDLSTREHALREERHFVS